MPGQGVFAQWFSAAPARQGTWQGPGTSVRDIYPGESVPCPWLTTPKGMWTLGVVWEVLEVDLLVVEEDVGPQYVHDRTLVDAAEKEGVVDCHSPFVQTQHGALMCRCVACRDDGNVNADRVVLVLPAAFLLSSLQLVDLAQEVSQRARVVRGRHVHGLVSAETLYAVLPEDPLGFVAGEDAVEVEGDPQVPVLRIVGDGGAEDPTRGQPRGHGLPDVVLVRGQEQ